MEKRNAHSTLKFNKNKVGLKRRFFDKSISLPILSLFFFFLFTSLISAQSIGISNCTQLQNINLNLSADYHLTQNIDCSGINFIPIGSLNINWTENAFMGIFDGNNYNISNLYINITDDDNNIVGGLFGLLGMSGIVTNVGIINANVTFNHYSWGSAGILVGESYGIINNSYTTGTIKGTQLVGGLLGYNWNLLSNSYSNANVIAENYSSIGGLVGNNDAHIINSYSTGNVTGIGTGIYIGGLVGFFYEGTINNSYSTGNVIGDTSVGGLIGYNFNGTITNSYYDTNTTGQSDTGKGEPKTTIEMQNITTFVNWDIVLIENFNETSIWYIDNGNDYPRLYYECLNNICVLIPEPEKDYAIIFINIALIIIIVTFFFVFITENKFVKMRNLK